MLNVLCFSSTYLSSALMTSNTRALSTKRKAMIKSYQVGLLHKRILVPKTAYFQCV